MSVFDFSFVALQNGCRDIMMAGSVASMKNNRDMRYLWAEIAPQTQKKIAALLEVRTKWKKSLKNITIEVCYQNMFLKQLTVKHFPNNSDISSIMKSVILGEI